MPVTAQGSIEYPIQTQGMNLTNVHTQLNPPTSRPMRRLLMLEIEEIPCSTPLHTEHQVRKQQGVSKSN